MKLRRLEQIAMIAAGAGLALAGVASLFAPADTQGLNRLPAERPAFSIMRLNDEAYRSAWSDYLADKLVLASLARRANLQTEVRLFNDAAADAVIRGREGWLYYRLALGAPLPPSDPGRADAALAGAVEAVAALERAGLDTRFALAPDKPGQYPQFLPPRERDVASAALAYRNALRPRFAAALGARWLDVFDAMEAAIAADLDRLYYLREDTHWSDLGAAVMAEAVLQAFAPGMWDEAALLPIGANSYSPDLLLMQGERAERSYDRYAVRRPGVEVERINGARAQGWTRRYVARSAGAPLAGRLVIIGDSFANPLAPLLAPYFEELHWIEMHSFNPQLAGPIIADADFALVMIVERHVLEPSPLGPAGLGQLMAQALEASSN